MSETIGYGTLVELGGSRFEVKLTADENCLTIWRGAQAYTSIPYPNISWVRIGVVDRSAMGKAAEGLFTFIGDMIFGGATPSGFRDALFIKYDDVELQREVEIPIAMSERAAQKTRDKIFIHRDRFMRRLSRGR